MTQTGAHLGRRLEQGLCLRVRDVADIGTGGGDHLAQQLVNVFSLLSRGPFISIVQLDTFRKS